MTGYGAFFLAAEAEKASGQAVRMLLRVGRAAQGIAGGKPLKSLLQFGSQFDNIEIK